MDGEANHVLQLSGGLISFIGRRSKRNYLGGDDYGGLF